MGSGEFSGPEQTPAIRQAPPFHLGGIRQVAQQGGHTWGSPFGSGNRAGPGRPPSSPVLPDQLSIFSLPWYLSPALGPSPPSRELGHPQTPMGSGEFSGQGQTPAIRQAPPLHFGGIRQFAQQDNGHHN